jgi:hypothetical protein
MKFILLMHNGKPTIATETEFDGKPEIQTMMMFFDPTNWELPEAIVKTLNEHYREEE